MIFFFQTSPKAQKAHENGRGFHYNPSKDNTEFVRWLAQEQARKHGWKPYAADVPVAVSVVFVFHAPKYIQRKREYVGNLPHVKKPDLDNLLKLHLDALAGVAYVRDQQIQMLGHVSKIYTDKADEAGTFIAVDEFRSRSYSTHEKVRGLREQLRKLNAA